MTRFQGAFLVWLAFFVFGCSQSPSPSGNPHQPAGDASKKITWEQFQQMPPEEQADPYVLTNLDDEAKKKFDAMVKKQMR